MKLRFFNNSIRFRVQQSEVEQFKNTGKIDAFVQLGFADSHGLHYSVQINNVAQPTILYEGNTILLLLPEVIAKQWSHSNDTGIYDIQTLDEGKTLKIILEKDFQCLDETNEDQSDMYPNPKALG